MLIHALFRSILTPLPDAKVSRRVFLIKSFPMQIHLRPTTNLIALPQVIREAGNGGGEGSRTPVLKTFHEGIYKFSQAFAALRSVSLTRPVH